MIADFIKTAYSLARQSWDNRAITWELARRDLTRQYKGAALGVVWAAAQPISYVFIFWFAVEIGLRGSRGPTNGFPFILWLVPGMFAWRVINSTLSLAGNSIRSYSELVTKVVFPSITIPQFNVISLFQVHAWLMVFAAVLLLVLGYPPTLYWIQLPYVVGANFAFCVVIATLLSALTTFSRDLVQIVKTSTTALFWFTPVIWPSENVSGALGMVLRLNPIAYIVESYRWTLIYGRWFWESPGWTLYFWVFLILLGGVTLYVWNKLSRYFADVL